MSQTDDNRINKTKSRDHGGLSHEDKNRDGRDDDGPDWMLTERFEVIGDFLFRDL